MASFPLPQPEAGKEFSDIYYEKLVEFLEVNLTKLWEPPYDLFPLEFSLLSFHDEPLVVAQLEFRFSYLGLVPRMASTHESLFWEAFTPYIYLSISLMLRQWFSLHPPLYYGSKKSCWCFSLFRFLLVVKIEWKLSCSLNVELETAIEHFIILTVYPLHQDAYMESKGKIPTASHEKGVAGGQLAPQQLHPC